MEYDLKKKEICELTRIALQKHKTIDKTALSWWFPRIEAAGLPVPRTKLLKMPHDAAVAIWATFDGKDSPDGGTAMKRFAAEIADAAAEFGYPFFLRTDMTSGKHYWKDTCFIASADIIAQHVFNIAEFSECVDAIGLLWDTWAVREFLSPILLGVCPRYGNMPVCREFRFFVTDGKVQCWHPYWPRHALEDGGAIFDFDYGAMSSLDADTEREFIGIAEAAGRAVGGAWSVDILETRIGWYITDMAEAHKSFHWEGCEHGVES